MDLVVDRCAVDLELPKVGKAHVRGLADVGEGPFPVPVVDEEAPDLRFRVDFRIPLEPRCLTHSVSPLYSDGVSFFFSIRLLMMKISFAISIL